ncbi:pseudouridylate synthase 7 homolog isoform X4 [Mytilus trossulus]|uniref:pseudouridylate synthase 7 homolog isoform X1 n=1 Tax=Mytilus trossulus TaxID=6551 RepID=UPI0030054B19
MEPEAKKARLETDAITTCRVDNQYDDISCDSTPVTKETDNKDVSSSNNQTEDVKFVKETDVGILCYINDLPGCHGVIKQRYSDFIVNEVDVDGKVVELTKTEVDKISEEEKVQNEEEESFKLPEDVMKTLLALSSESEMEPAFIHMENMDDKELRTKYHQTIKSKFPGLDSSTVTQDDKKVIKVVKKANTKMKNRWKNEWPAGRGNYCQFVLYKENRDTMSAINDMSRFLSVNRNLFQYAGTKDKRAKTSQEITVYRMFAERLEELNTRMKYMHFGNYRYVNEPLRLGKCQGNKFTIVLRNVTGDDETLDKSMMSLKEKGFINYFGMQRFGTTSIPTHHIGRAVLKNDYEEAVNLILKPRPGETGRIVECRQCWERNKDPVEALIGLPNQNAIEKTILKELKSNKHNFCNAFQKIARNTKLMYLHAYQSYLWNSVTSQRIKQHGLQPVIGDLVLTEEIQELQEGEDNDNKDIRIVQPIVLDEKNVSQYSILDVVLPLPGHDVTYPPNEVRKWYETLLAEDGLTLDSFKHKIKSLSLPGAYRKIVIKPGDVVWKLYRYNDVNVELALSDLDKLQKKAEPSYEQDGQFKALKIEMTLPSSCYATMALREVLKIDTSASYQSTLNVT